MTSWCWEFNTTQPSKCGFCWKKKWWWFNAFLKEPNDILWRPFPLEVSFTREISGERILWPQDLRSYEPPYYSPTIKKNPKESIPKILWPPKNWSIWSIHPYWVRHFPMTSHHHDTTPCRTEIPSLRSRLHLSSCLPTFRPSGEVGGGYRENPWNMGGVVGS